MQTKRTSFTEACINTTIGYIINYSANLVLLPLFLHVKVDPVVNIYMGFAYTIIAVIRSYYVRRMFNWWHYREYAYFNNKGVK